MSEGHWKNSLKPCTNCTMDEVVPTNNSLLNTQSTEQKTKFQIYHVDNFLPNLVQNNENKHPQKSKMAKLKQHVLTRFQTFHFTTRSLQATQESLNNKQTFHMWVYRDENTNNTFTVGEWRHAIYMVDFKTHPDFMRPSVALFFSGGGSKFFIGFVWRIFRRRWRRSLGCWLQGFLPSEIDEEAHHSLVFAQHPLHSYICGPLDQQKKSALVSPTRALWLSIQRLRVSLYSSGFLNRLLSHECCEGFLTAFSGLGHPWIIINSFFDK